MGKLVLYGTQPSPPVRTVQMTLEALGLKYEFKQINLLDGENKTADFLKKNPQHTVPLLEDDGKYIWESHAICAYLVRKYGKDDSLYPKDYYRRAVVDQRLHFESSVIFQGCLRNIAIPVFFKGETTVPREKFNAIYEAYGFLEAFLDNQQYLCGNELTIADFSCISSVSSLVGLAPIDVKRFPKLQAWLNRCEVTIKNYEQTNGNGAKLLIDLFNERIKKIVD